MEHESEDRVIYRVNRLFRQTKLVAATALLGVCAGGAGYAIPGPQNPAKPGMLIAAEKTCNTIEEKRSVLEGITDTTILREKNQLEHELSDLLQSKHYRRTERAYHGNIAEAQRYREEQAAGLSYSMLAGVYLAVAQLLLFGEANKRERKRREAEDAMSSEDEPCRRS